MGKNRFDFRNLIFMKFLYKSAKGISKRHTIFLDQSNIRELRYTVENFEGKIDFEPWSPISIWFKPVR